MSADRDAKTTASCQIHRGEWGDRYCTVHRCKWTRDGQEDACPDARAEAEADLCAIRKAKREAS
ncbi:MAG: hypothetical protein J7518_12460 [Nocardioidaceae bacterium]|nr:hypothetical protein [Nocardioidaceae bacterium]